MNVDWQSPLVWLLFIVLILGCAVIGGVIFILLRAFKLYIPKSKLFDDTYIQITVKRVKLLRRICLAVFTVQFACLLVGGILQFNHVVDLFSERYRGATFVFFIVTNVMFSFSLGAFSRRAYSLKQYLNAEDLLYRIGLNRTLYRRK